VSAIYSDGPALAYCVGCGRVIHTLSDWKFATSRPGKLHRACEDVR
jgi:predicted Fe-S protein YdhL (DUF1289 family)